MLLSWIQNKFSILIFDKSLFLLHFRFGENTQPERNVLLQVTINCDITIS